MGIWCISVVAHDPGESVNYTPSKRLIWDLSTGSFVHQNISDRRLRTILDWIGYCGLELTKEYFVIKLLHSRKYRI